VRRRWWRALGGLGIGLAAVLAVAVVGWVLIKWAPDQLADTGLTKDASEEVGRVRTALLASVAGLIAVVGAIFTGLSYRLNRAGQITERFTRAIDQLGEAELDVRLGGIYALERIARDSKDDHPRSSRCSPLTCGSTPLGHQSHPQGRTLSQARRSSSG
jgi:hypothetical protein